MFNSFFPFTNRIDLQDSRIKYTEFCRNTQMLQELFYWTSIDYIIYKPQRSFFPLKLAGTCKSQ